jgi:hypothetical protein
MPPPGTPLESLPPLPPRPGSDTDDVPPAGASLIQLRPLELPVGDRDASPIGAVADDVVLAIQRAIAAIAAAPTPFVDGAGEDPLPRRQATAVAVADEQVRDRLGAEPADSWPSWPSWPSSEDLAAGDQLRVERDDSREVEETPRRPAAAGPGRPVDLAIPVLPPRPELALASPGAPTEARRTALKRLIAGLRRR